MKIKKGQVVVFKEFDHPNESIGERKRLAVADFDLAEQLSQFNRIEGRRAGHEYCGEPFDAYLVGLGLIEDAGDRLVVVNLLDKINDGVDDFELM